jgi:hypothetical protein
MVIPTVYIIDTYNKYSRDKIISIFQLNGHWYCIKEVELDKDGKPILSSIMDNDFLYFKTYSTLDEALLYVRKQRITEGEHN